MKIWNTWDKVEQHYDFDFNAIYPIPFTSNDLSFSIMQPFFYI